jgi:hypothetical protein
MQTFLGNSQVTRRTTMNKAIQAKMALELLETDEESGTEYLEAYKKFMTVQGSDWRKKYETIEEYLEFRFSEVGVE